MKLKILFLLNSVSHKYIAKLISLNITFSKKSFKNTIRVSNSSMPDQNRDSVGLDLVPNCYQRLSEDDKSRLYIARKELYFPFCI